MRKRTTKLSLHRETLRHLDPMQKVAGGVGTSEECLAPTGCECPGTVGCVAPTVFHTCGTTCTVPTGYHQCG
ncbi:MAG TPA: hypothetical protein VEL74_10080 [Thermoanaerobaculia bacterium]|nr:hypothetical protein [Thermoanaerobaculia bacterium]